MQKICPTNIRFSIESPTRAGRNKKVIFFVYEQHQLLWSVCLAQFQFINRRGHRAFLIFSVSSVPSVVCIELIAASVSFSLSRRPSAMAVKIYNLCDF